LFNRTAANGTRQQESAKVDSLRETPVAPSKPKRRTPRFIRWLVIASLSLLGLTLAAALVINTWFLDDLLRWALARQERHSGVHVECEKISASLWSGRYEVSGVRVTRSNHPAGEIDLSARSVTVSLPFWSAWKGTVPIRSLGVDGLRGRYHLGRRVEHESSQPEGAPGHRPSPDLERKPARHFVIDTLEITDLAVEVTDHTLRKPLSLPITIAHMTSSPLHSDWALFDILFRSNAEGSLMGRPFKIASSGDGAGRVTAWTVSELPVEALDAIIGGPFSLITQGRCDVQVTDRWRLGVDHVIEMDWKLILHDVHCEVPAELTGIRRTLAIAVVAMLNANPRQVPLGFTLHIDRNRFEGTTTLEAAGLWQAVDEALTRKLAEKTGLAPEKIDQLQKDAADAAKGLLDRWRKRKK
jgi:hypothetical protein